MYKSESSFDNLKKQYVHDAAFAQKCSKSFQELFLEVIKEKRINATIFAEKTLMSEMMFARYKNGARYPSLRAITAIGIAFNLDMPLVEMLLDSTGVKFDWYNDVDYAYYFLIKHFSGKSLYICNDFLKLVGIDQKHFLGNRMTTEG